MKCGIDLSNSVCGLAVSDNKKIINAVALDISGENTYDGKSNIITKQLDDWLLLYKDITDFNIEGALNAFAFGKTNALTLITLIKINAVISYILSKKYPAITINSLNMRSARKTLFGKCMCKGIKPKVFVKMMIESINPECKSFYLPVKSKRCKKENVLNDDIRDACVMSLV